MGFSPWASFAALPAAAPGPWRGQPFYRFFLNLYCNPTEIAKFTSVWVILVPRVCGSLAGEALNEPLDLGPGRAGVRAAVSVQALSLVEDDLLDGDHRRASVSDETAPHSDS